MVRRTVSYKVLHIQHGEQILRNISEHFGSENLLKKKYKTVSTQLH